MCSATTLPSALQPATDTWRPTLDDVDAISRGQRAKRRGTGSRAVPHRLNSEERTLFDLARRRGYLEIRGSGWRAERGDAPVVNSYRSWCDARSVAAIFVHKRGREASLDEVSVDLAPLRAPHKFSAAAAELLAREPDGGVRVENGEGPIAWFDELEPMEQESVATSFRTDPIYRLPAFSIVWHRPRPEAKALAKSLAGLLETEGAVSGSTRKPRRPRADVSDE